MRRKVKEYLFLRRFMHHPGTRFGVVTLSLIVLGAALVPFSPYDPKHNNIREKLHPPSIEHLMGTDALGRDVFTRVLYGGRTSLPIGIGVMLISFFIGTSVGILAGYGGFWIDSVIMRITDAFLSFPPLLVLIFFSALITESRSSFFERENPLILVIAIGLFSWMTIARLSRTLAFSLKEAEFITAAQSLGSAPFHIMIQHILPNVAGPVIVASTLEVANAILTESGLSFVGFGVHPRTPTWGNMLSDSQRYMLTHPWLTLFPGFMIFMTVLSINYIGDGLRDALDPYHN